MYDRVIEIDQVNEIITREFSDEALEAAAGSRGVMEAVALCPGPQKLVRGSREIAANALGGPLFIHADADIASLLSGLRALLNRVVRNAL